MLASLLVETEEIEGKAKAKDKDKAPVDEDNTRYYWFQHRNSDPDNQEVSEKMFAGAKMAFEEDREGDVIAVLEQDTEGDRGVVWTSDNWASFEAALRDDDWKLVRLSYRPHDFEPPGGMYAYLGAGGEKRPLRPPHRRGPSVRSFGPLVRSSIYALGNIKAPSFNSFHRLNGGTRLSAPTSDRAERARVHVPQSSP